MIGRTIIVTLLGALIAIAPMQAQDGAILLADYWQRIAEARAAVETAQQTSDLLPLREQADRLDSISVVILSDGTQVPISHDYLVRLMRSDSPPLDHLAETLDLMLEASQAETPSPNESPTIEQLTEERAHVLSRPEFQYKPTPVWDAVTRLTDELFSLLGRFSSPLGFSSRIIIAIVGLVIVVVAAAFALRKILEGAVREARYRPELEEMDILTSETALTRASETSDQGDYRSAVRYLYLSTLLLLEERGLLRYDRTRTNLEYIRSLRHRPETAAILAEVVDVFDRVWYGFQPIDADTYARYAQRVSDLQRQQ